MDLAEEFARYLEIERNLAPNTVQAYRRDVGQYLAFLPAGVEPTTASFPIVRKYAQHLAHEGLGARSRARKLAAVRALYRYLAREYAVAADPTKGIASPKLPKRLPKLLDRHEIAVLLAAPGSRTPQRLRDRALLHLLYATGLRIAEALALDVDVAVALKPDEEGLCEILVEGKGRKERVVLADREVLGTLVDYLERGRPEL
ncbi:MAG: site-specific integrase, partial [Cyanobacteria bacterium REEB65]|nr:site-specific integrase [Cyanobacteria bacterium REEB65]